MCIRDSPYSADQRYNGQDERRGGTVGFPLPGVSLRVQGDDGKDPVSYTHLDVYKRQAPSATLPSPMCPAPLKWACPTTP